jgi:hypothetical protein
MYLEADAAAGALAAEVRGQTISRITAKSDEFKLFHHLGAAIGNTLFDLKSARFLSPVGQKRRRRIGDDWHYYADDDDDGEEQKAFW